MTVGSWCVGICDSERREVNITIHNYKVLVWVTKRACQSLTFQSPHQRFARDATKTRMSNVFLSSTFRGRHADADPALPTGEQRFLGPRCTASGLP